MPGRAQQLTPAQAYQMAPSRFGVPLKVLTNKKALDLAFQKHTWEMQKQAQNLAGGNLRQHISGQYGLRQQELANQRSASSTLEANVLAQAVKLAQDDLIDLNTPEGQSQFQNIYQSLLSQVKPGSSPQPPPDAPQTPDLTTGIKAGNSGFVQPGTKKTLDAETARRILKKAGSDKNKARELARKLGYEF